MRILKIKLINFNLWRKTPRNILILTGFVIGFFLRYFMIIKVFGCDSNKSSNFFSKLSFNTEKNENNFLLIGVMTASKFVDTRVKATWDTWAKSVSGKVLFFSSEGTTSKYPLPIVGLKHIDDSYPPLKKAFMTLKYMHDNYINQYEWFMRADDDMYMRPEKLEKFLRSVNSSIPQYISQPGRGNEKDFGLLSLEEDENFCMGGPGVVMSRQTMKNLISNLEICLKHLYSKHDDVEIGRCITMTSNITCTWGYDTEKYFYSKEVETEYGSYLQNSNILDAISIHPLKNISLKYRVHSFYNMQKIIELRQKQLLLRREIRTIEKKLLNISKNSILIKNKSTNDKLPNDRFILSPTYQLLKPPKKRLHRHDMIFFTDSINAPTHENPNHGFQEFWKLSLKDNVRQLYDKFNMKSLKNNESFDFIDIKFGYKRYHPLIGLDLIINSKLTYKKFSVMENKIYNHSFVRQTFNDMIFREDMDFKSIYYQNQENMENNIVNNLINFIMPKHGNEIKYKIDSTINEKTIHFVVTLAGRLDIFERFMNNFENVCLKNNENVKLAIVYFNENNKTENGSSPLIAIKNVIDNLNMKYSIDSLILIVKNQTFSRSIGCNIGSSLYDVNSLIFFIDIDLIFNSDVLLRVRLNTIQGKQVYFPIVLTEFDPDPDLLNGKVKRNIIDDNINNHYNLNPDSGFWNEYGFGMLCVYNSDLLSVGAFDSSIIGWGKEDVDIFDKFLASKLNIFRAVDPNFIHIFHKRGCDLNLTKEQFQMCQGSYITAITSQRIFALHYFKKGLIPKNFKPINATKSIKPKA